MAAEAVNAPINGTYSHQPNPYGAAEPSFAAHQTNGSASTTAATPAAQQQSDISKEEVAWYFVESYYTTMSLTPEKLYLFFNKRSRMVQGVEEVKSSVSAGQKAIKERITSLDFQDCKVRVTNVDSQPSDDNIVIQVIGEMSNKAQPHRKFVQTFVLATQQNGYFVLNDIFRYIAEDEEETEPEASEPVEIPSGFKEPAPTGLDSAVKSLNSGKETVTHEPDVAEVDKKLDEIVHEEEAKEAASPAQTNGTPVPEAAEVTPTEDAPAAAVSAPEEPEVKEAPVPVVQEVVQAEKPKAPVPTPAPAKAAPPPVAAPAAPAAPPKPAVPKTWAQLASANRAAAAAAAPAVSAPAPAPSATQAKTAAPTPAAAQPKPAAATSTAPPVRQPSPAGSQQEGSSGGWQTAGAEHSRSKSRAQAPIVGPDGKVRAYVKNVYASVDADELKAHLSKFGELAYFDVSRQKNSAFAEFKTVGGFQAAVAANPHKLGGAEDIFIEERRPAGSFNPRGGIRGGARGGFEGRGRGTFNGRGGRGAPRGDRPQAA